jgi:hypothetical protein
MGMDTQQYNNLMLSHNTNQANTIASSFRGNNTGWTFPFLILEMCEGMPRVNTVQEKQKEKTQNGLGTDSALQVRIDCLHGKIHRSYFTVVAFRMRDYAKVNQRGKMGSRARCENVPMNLGE